MADFLDGMFNDDAAPAEVVETPVEQPAEQQVEAPPEPEAPPAPEPAPEPEAPKEDMRTIPLATGLNWRDEAKDAKREAKEYKQRWEEAVAERQSPQQIDPFDDPQAFAAQQQGLVQKAIIEDRFARSNEDAVEKYGEDTVKAAVDWAASRAQQHPTFATEYMGKTRPIHWIVQQHQRDAMLSEIGDNPDDYFAREAAKRGYVLPNAPVAEALLPPVVQPASKPTPPPRSIASDRSAAPAAVSPAGDRDGFLASIVGK